MSQVVHAEQLVKAAAKSALTAQAALAGIEICKLCTPAGSHASERSIATKQADKTALRLTKAHDLHILQVNKTI